VVGENGAAPRLDLAVPLYAHAGALKTEVETTDAAEK